VGFAVPQDGHVTVSMRGVAHSAQKRALSRFGWPQDGQSIVELGTSAGRHESSGCLRRRAAASLLLCAKHDS
jgi:hypothetical protein